MGDLQKWKNANPPNYETNKDKLYPYSELPDLSEYQLIKIPYCVKNLIEHVDYFGLGRIETTKGYVGFPNCYNVNYQYCLVPSGEDKSRKIPNRIPIANSSNSSSGYYTSNYIKDNSVLTVTFTPYSEHMSVSIAKDIARIVSGYSGKVIVYGYNINDDWQCNQILIISEELKKMKQLFYCPMYMIPDDLQLTHYKTSYRVYLSLNELKNELYNNVEKGEHEAAIILTGCLTDVYCFNALSEVVTKLLENKVQNVIAYAYKLWTNNAKNIVCKYFPTVFQLIFNSDCINIVNKKYNQALIIENSKKMQACGTYKKGNSNAKWKINPIWDITTNTLTFNLRNVDRDLFLYLDIDDNNRKLAYGFKDSTIETFYFEPLLIDGQIAFSIKSHCYEVLLQMCTTDNSSKNNAVLWGKGNPANESYLWTFTPWQQMEANDDYKLNAKGIDYMKDPIII